MFIYLAQQAFDLLVLYIGDRPGDEPPPWLNSRL